MFSLHVRRIYRATACLFFGLLWIAGPWSMACDNFEKTSKGTFETSVWYRFDPETNMVHFCQKIKRLKDGTDPFWVEPHLKTGGWNSHTIKVLDRQKVSVKKGECKTVCWWFEKPEKLDLDSFYEYSDFENEDGGLFDWLWRKTKIWGFTSSKEEYAQEEETMPWPMYNFSTLLMPDPIEAVVVVDMSDAMQGWRVLETNPPLNTPFMLQPGERALGSITVQGPPEVREGVSVIRPQVVELATGHVIQEVHFDFDLDFTKPEITRARAYALQDKVMFQVVAEDTHSGVADRTQVFYSVNDGPFESEFLEQTLIDEGIRVNVVEQGCNTCRDETTLFLTKTFQPGDRLRYYFVVPDEAGNVATTEEAELVVTGDDCERPASDPTDRSKRMFSHVTDNDSEFTTTIIITNPTDDAQFLQIVPYDTNGNPLPVMEDIIGGQSTFFQEASDLFGRFDVAYFEILEGDVHISASYTIQDGNPSHVLETEKQARRWRIFPGNWDKVFDGMAIVNTGRCDATVTINQLAPNGAVMGSITLESMPIGAKRLVVLNNYFPTATHAEFEVVSQEPLGLTALRFSKPDLTTSWQNPAIPLP